MGILNRAAAQRAMFTLAATCVVALGVPCNAPAQERSEAPAAAAPELAEVVVTGSRIVAPNVASTSPVQVITAQELKSSGYTHGLQRHQG